MDSNLETNDEIATVLKARNWADWRSSRFKELTFPEIREKIAVLATIIKTTIKTLEDVLAASQGTDSAATGIQPTITPAPTALYTLLVSPEVREIRTNPRISFKSEIYEEVIKCPYYAYTTTFYDEEMIPSEIVQPSEIMELYSTLLVHIRQEMESSESAISTQSTSIEKMGKKQSISIMFLIDNSGSMRGEKVLGIACWISIISGILAQYNISNEVVGFTTRAWKGGNSRELWLKDGKPARPGRLNDVRYVIYKSFEQTQQEANANFGVMIREGVLKENIDGEALLWGYSRLSLQPEKRKLLIVLSDGAPVDDSTLSVNRENFLEAHCRAAINWIRSKEDIELYGIGVEFDVSRYYGAGSPTLSAQKVGPDLLILTALAVEQRWDEAAAIQRTSIPRRSPILPPLTSRRRGSKKP